MQTNIKGRKQMQLLKQLIKNFDFTNITGADKLSLESNKTIDICIRCIYEDVVSKTLLHISLKLIGCHSKPEDWPSLIAFLDINKLAVSNISHFGWEGLHWLVEDHDDDGLSLFKIFCDDIKVIAIADKSTFLYQAAQENKSMV